ncbi:MAG: nSTAND1 domain-containing NTPase [Pirellulaceae bacterium]
MSPAPLLLNPFPGLRAFAPEEDYLFFGREEQTLELLARLGRHHFVAVVGTSGSGKSSLVRCGLLSELLGGKMLGAGAAWEVAVTHPGGNPLALLTEALLEAELYDRALENTRENLLATLSRSHFGLVEAVKQAGLGSATNFLLVVDQFEELFRFHEAGQTQQELANEFVSLLLEAAAQKEVPIYVVLTMRSDFIGECGQFEGLAEAVNRGEFLIPRLTRQQYKRVIEGPIKVAGGQIAPRLLQRLLNDLGQQADQLPCLQHALMRTWNASAQREHAAALDLEDYQQVGRMSEALSQHADEVWDSLASDRARALCAGVFKALTVQESENRGTRRPQRLGRLCQILDVSADALRPVIDAYRQAGVTFLMPSQEVELTDRTIIDISHESLMRVWTRLRRWVEEESQAAGIYLRLSESAALYEQGKAGLYRDPELGIALAWQESQRPNAAWAERYRAGFAAAMSFLEASQQASVAEVQAREAARQRELKQAQQLAEAQQQRLEQQHRAARKLRTLIRGLAVVATVAGLACVAALIAHDQANKLRIVASLETKNAQQSAVKAEQSALEANSLRDAAQRAEQAMKETATQAAADRNIAQRESYRSTIKLAESMLQGDDDARFRVADILWQTQPELRAWEWGHLMAQCPLEEWSLQTDPDGLQAAAATADGRFLVTAGTNGMVTLWDLESRQQMWQAQTGPVYQLTVDPLNRFIGASSADKTLRQFRILDLATGILVHESEQTGQAQLAFSPHGDELYVFDEQDTLRCIATSTWEERVRIGDIALTNPHLVVDLAGHCVSIYSEMGPGPKFQFFDAQTLGATNQLDGLHEQVVNVRSPSTPVLNSTLGEVIFSFTTAVYRKTVDGKRRLLCEHSDYVKHLAVDPVSGTVLSATTNGAVQIVDADGKKQSILHGAPITGLATLTPGRFITAGADGLVKCWKLTPPDTLAFKTSTPGMMASVNFLEFASDGKSLLCRTWDRHNFQYAMDSLSYRHFVFPDRVGNNDLFPMIRPRTNELVTDSKDGLLFFPPESGGTAAESTRSISISAPISAAFDVAGRILVVSSNDGKTAVFDLESNEQFPTPQLTGSGPVVVNLSGTRAAVRTKDQLQVWEVATGRRLNSLDVVKEETSLPPIFHPDGELIAVVDGVAGSRFHSKLTLWDCNQGQTRAVVQLPAGIEFRDCTFSDDGRRLFFQCSDHRVRVIDWTLGKELIALSGGKNVDQLVVSPDGLTVAYAGFAPALFIAKSLPCGGDTSRNAAFYHAVDDLRLFTAQTARAIYEKEGKLVTFTNRSDKRIRIDYRAVALFGLVKSEQRTLQELSPGERGVYAQVPTGTEFFFIDPESSERLESFAKSAAPIDDEEGPVGINVSGPDQATTAGIEELLGDVARRQGRLADANAHYAAAVAIHKEIVLENPSKAAPQGSLALVLTKKLSVEANSKSDDPTILLEQAAEFWQKLMENPNSHPAGWQHLVSFQLRLLDHQLAMGAADFQHRFVSLLSFWSNQTEQQPENRLCAYGLAEMSGRVLAVYPDGLDQELLDKLIAEHPGMVGVFGDAYAGERDWAHAIAIYSWGIQKDSPSRNLFAKRARAYEQQQDWEAAIADYSKLITAESPDADWLAKRAAAYVATENWNLAQTDWRRVVEQQPEQIQRAFDEFQQAECWNGAAEFGLQLVQQQPEDTMVWLRVAPILILTEDQASYADFCGRLVQQFAESKLPEVSERVVKASLLRANSIDLAKLPGEMFAKSLDDGTVPDWFSAWGWGTRALLAYRSSDAESAVKYVTKSEEYKPSERAHALNLAVLAMAQHQLQHPDEARRALEEVSQVITRLEEASNYKVDHDLLIGEILFREAQSLIHGKPDP